MSEIRNEIQERVNLLISSRYDEGTEAKKMAKYTVVEGDLPLMLMQLTMVDEIITGVKFRDIQFGLNKVDIYARFVACVNASKFNARVVKDYNIEDYKILKSVKSFAVAPGRIVINASDYAKDLRNRYNTPSMPSIADVNGANKFFANNFKSCEDLDAIDPIKDRAEIKFADLYGYEAKDGKYVADHIVEISHFRLWKLGIDAFGLESYDLYGDMIRAWERLGTVMISKS